MGGLHQLVTVESQQIYAISEKYIFHFIRFFFSHSNHSIFLKMHKKGIYLKTYSVHTYSHTQQCHQQKNSSQGYFLKRYWQFYERVNSGMVSFADQFFFALNTKICNIKKKMVF